MWLALSADAEPQGKRSPWQRTRNGGGNGFEQVFSHTSSSRGARARVALQRGHKASRRPPRLITDTSAAMFVAATPASPSQLLPSDLQALPPIQRNRTVPPQIRAAGSPSRRRASPSLGRGASIGHLLPRLLPSCCGATPTCYGEACGTSLLCVVPSSPGFIQHAAPPHSPIDQPGGPLMVQTSPSELGSDVSPSAISPHVNGRHRSVTSRGRVAPPRYGKTECLSLRISSPLKLHKPEPGRRQSRGRAAQAALPPAFGMTGRTGSRVTARSRLHLAPLGAITVEVSERPSCASAAPEPLTEQRTAAAKPQPPQPLQPPQPPQPLQPPQPQQPPQPPRRAEASGALDEHHAQAPAADKTPRDGVRRPSQPEQAEGLGGGGGR